MVLGFCLEFVVVACSPHTNLDYVKLTDLSWFCEKHWKEGRRKDFSLSFSFFPERNRARWESTGSRRVSPSPTSEEGDLLKGN